MKSVGTLVLLVSASVASATILFQEGNVPQTDENILYTGTGTVQSGNPVIGRGNNTSFLFQFNSTTTLTGSGGQSRVEGNFLDLTLSMVDVDFGFTSAIFNLNAANSGNVTINVNWLSPSNAGNSTDTFDLSGNGQNFFTITSIDQQVIQSIELTTTADVADIRQVRIGGRTVLPDGTPGGDPGGEIPEPMTMSLLGGGLTLIALFRRKLYAA
jgi:hypothetical protein